MSVNPGAARVGAHRRLAATELIPGDEVRLDGKAGLVVRVVGSRQEVMVELWSRGAVEHRSVFLDPDHLVEAVGTR